MAEQVQSKKFFTVYFRTIMLTIDWVGETFILHPSRCMYWEKEQALVISDLHLGKTGHFRREGIAVPQQVYKQDLLRLFDTIRYFNPREVLLTGDLFHSRTNLEWEWFARWRHEITDCNFTLVLGNHDKISGSWMNTLNMSVVSFLRASGLLFVHDAHSLTATDEGIKGVVSGHIHPAIKLPTGARQSARLPCFHFTRSTCTLPAFSLFTGTHVIRPGKHDRLFALTGKEVVEVQLS